jgi:hypothetical protein
VKAPCPAEDKDLRQFHSAEYIECLQEVSKLDDDEKCVNKMEEFGLGIS